MFFMSFGGTLKSWQSINTSHFYPKLMKYCVSVRSASAFKFVKYKYSPKSNYDEFFEYPILVHIQPLGLPSVKASLLDSKLAFY